MWMMGCNEGGEICLPTNNDSFTSCRNLRPLIPRPPTNHNTDPPNHHHRHPHHRATMTEQSKRELNSVHQVMVSARWNPTPEQLRALEEMYRRGTRTPSADQIQQITSQLRRYGKIEGKNVFYWFQNHKARERQKRRHHLNNHRETGKGRCKEPGSSCKTTSDDVQRANNSYNWEAVEGSNIDKGERSEMAAGRERGSASASSSATAVKATSTSSASSTAVVKSLWMELNDTRELFLQNSNLIITGNSINNYDNLGRNATCPPRPVVHPTSTTTSRTFFTALYSSSPPPSFPSQDFQTLQLFPLRSEEYQEDDPHCRQFFEFLPMKN